MESRENETEIVSIESLTPSLFFKLLQTHWKECETPNIQRLSVPIRLEQGVLSQVYRVDVEYDEITSVAPPSSWIIKLSRADLNLDWMFRSERAFYTFYGPKLVTDDMPFTIPKPLNASNKHLILQFIPDSTCHELIDGCPPQKIGFLTKALACWHAQTWQSSLFASNEQINLASPPGMGHRLSPLQKEHLFSTQWVDAVENLKLEDASALKFIVSLCSRMSTLRLRDVHGKVHKERWACVHGDYHIANWLFPDNGTKPVLVDWAACGFGNPMVDCAFFLVVSATNHEVSNIDAWLEMYYRDLITHNPLISSAMKFDTLREMFQWALLCQWMTLVVYDKMCRSIASAEANASKKKLQLKHFENVNKRAVLAMHCIGNWDNIILHIPTATNDEQQEAEEYNRQTPLAI